LTGPGRPTTPPVIEHGPYTLRLPTAADVSWVFHACQDEDIQRFTQVPSPYGPADAIAFVGFAAEACVEGSGYHFLVAITETGELVGAASVGVHDEGYGEIGYWVERDARRQGVARSAVEAVEAWSRGALGVGEWRLSIAEANVASQAVARACGYERSPSTAAEPCKGLAMVVFVKRRPPGQPASD
jgi:RimJ/RimL family protein N-acetyltransferase